MLLKLRVEGRAVMIERLYTDGSSSTVVMPVANAAQAAVKGEQLGRLFGLEKVSDVTWESRNG